MCRSAEYDSSQLVCRLSRNDRRTNPESYVEAATPTIDYLENQCAPGKSRRNLLLTGVKIKTCLSRDFYGYRIQRWSCDRMINLAYIGI